tara:strand:- start:776 stop:1093 length:318 start_codon:yes stop_codon:yes gene_type:complete
MSDKKKCFDACVDNNVSCPVKDCRYWIDYEEDLNCTIVCANDNGALSLREISDRMGVSFVRIKQIQDLTVSKFTKRLAAVGIKGKEARAVLAMLRSGEEDHSIME